MENNPSHIEPKVEDQPVEAAPVVVDTPVEPTSAIDAHFQKAIAESNTPDPEPASVATPEAYTPNLTYKYLDEERKFDESLSGVIQSKEVEDKLRELYQRSDGLDRHKDKSKELQSNYQHLQNNAQQMYNVIEADKAEKARLANLAKSDFRTYARTMGLDENSILKAAATIIDEQDNPELAEQNRRAYEQSQQAYQSTNRVQQLEQQVQRLSQVNLQNDFQSAMTGQYSGVRDQINNTLGQNFFETEVAKSGRELTTQLGRMATVAEAAQYTMNRFGNLTQQAPATPAPATAHQATPPVQNNVPAAPPHLGSGTQGTAPVKPRFKNFSEMKAHGQKMAEQRALQLSRK